MNRHVTFRDGADKARDTPPLTTFVSADPAPRAFYCLRPLEIPTPRWSAYDAQRVKLQMSPDLPMIQQERVVTSSIGYNPS
jgi:hypothetical protein